MEKTIEIPEGYEARIEGNKVILEPKESEDERIRRCMVTIVKVNKRSSFGLECNHGATWDEMLAYLERQKEQKPLSTEETELNSIAFLEQMGYTCIPKESRLNNSHNGPDFKKAVNDLGIVACLFANWKDESSRKTNDNKLIVDVNTIETIINVNHVIQESDVFDWEQAYQKGLNHGKIAGYNKAMKEQRPAGRSEEDEKMLAEVIDSLSDYEGLILYNSSSTSVEHLQKEISWLKSLRPSWKPSEDQIQVIYNVLKSKWGCVTDRACLLGLVNNLKKL